MSNKYAISLAELCVSLLIIVSVSPACAQEKRSLYIVHHVQAGTISIHKKGMEAPLLVQHAKEGVRPYIHPIMAPDGNGALTEYSPAHHKHQTGVYWGLKKVNGRDYFMNWKEDYWRRISADVITRAGDRVQWRTTYQLLGEGGQAVLTERMTWNFQIVDGKFLIDLEWQGKGETDVMIEQFYVGGLFVRMPWKAGVQGEVVNSSGQRNKSAEGQRARWNDIGIQIDGRRDWGHIAILDHPGNIDSPVAWRVDNELGVGPSRQIPGGWRIPEGGLEKFRYRLMVYTGDFQASEIDSAWEAFARTK